MIKWKNVNPTFNFITNHLLNNESILISNFGVFEVKIIEDTVMRNAIIDKTIYKLCRKH